MGADIEARNSSHDWTPLNIAAYKGCTEIVQLLLEAGADIEAKDYTGKTSLYFATSNSHNKVAKLLIQAGASINTIKDKKKLELAQKTLKSMLEKDNIIFPEITSSGAFKVVKLGQDGYPETLSLLPISQRFLVITKLRGDIINTVKKSGNPYIFVKELKNIGVEDRETLNSLLNYNVSKSYQPVETNIESISS